MKKIRSILDEKIRSLVYKYFYSTIVEILEDEFEILMYIIVDGINIKETKMKHLPSVGMEMQLLDDSNIRIFEIQKVKLSPYGNVAYLDGILK